MSNEQENPKDIAKKLLEEYNPQRLEDQTVLENSAKWFTKHLRSTFTSANKLTSDDLKDGNVTDGMQLSDVVYTKVMPMKSNNVPTTLKKRFKTDLRKHLRESHTSVVYLNVKVAAFEMADPTRKYVKYGIEVGTITI